jgi:molybdate transport system ATP-binding protein
LELKLKKRFAPRPGSAGFDLDAAFSANSGINVLFGPSGAGKSLTLDLIAGFAQPAEGRVLLNDRLLLDAATGVSLSPQARNCGYVFQRPTLFPHLSVRENLQLPVAHRPKLERHRRTARMLEAFRLEDLANRMPAEISGGQRQRVSIARALVAEPSILLLDEPSVGLDYRLKQELYDILSQVRDDFAIPILLVTHDLEEAFTLAGSMLVMLEGRIVQQGTPREIFHHPATPGVAELLGVYNLLAAEIKLLDPGNNRSKLRWNDVELEGRYYPGHLLGDQITIGVRRDEITVRPKTGKAERGQLVLPLEGASEQAKSALLRFGGGLIVEVPLSYYLDERHHREWVVEFQPDSLRVL